MNGQPGLSTLCLKYFELGLLLLVGNKIPTSDLRQSAWVLRRMGSLGVAAVVLVLVAPRQSDPGRGLKKVSRFLNP